MANLLVVQIGPNTLNVSTAMDLYRVRYAQETYVHIGNKVSVLVGTPTFCARQFLSAYFNLIYIGPRPKAPRLVKYYTCS